MNQISGTAPTDASTQQPQDYSQGADATGSAVGSSIGEGGFGSRGRARRRARFLRKARELAYRDLGGLVYNLHRFGQRNDALVLAKLTTLARIDSELRSIEAALGEREPVTVLREAGITACPRCAAIHSSEDRFCPNCGLSMSRHVDLPVAGAAAPSAPVPQPLPPQPQAAPTVTDQAPIGTPPPASAPAGVRVGGTTPGVYAQPTPGASPVSAQPAPSAGRSPTPPSSVEEATEIIRPGAPDS